MPGFFAGFFSETGPTGDPGAAGATDWRAFSSASWNGVRPEMPLLMASGDTARGEGGPISLLLGGGWLSIFDSIFGSLIGPIAAAAPGGGFELGRFGGEAVTANGFTIDFGTGEASAGMSMRRRFDGGLSAGGAAGMASARRFAADELDAALDDAGGGTTAVGAPHDAQNFADAFSSAPHFPHVIPLCYLAGRVSWRRKKRAENQRVLRGRPAPS